MSVNVSCFSCKVYLNNMQTLDLQLEHDNNSSKKSVQISNGGKTMRRYSKNGLMLITFRDDVTSLVSLVMSNVYIVCFSVTCRVVVCSVLGRPKLL